MRNTTLGELVRMYRAEAGMSLQPAQGVQQRDFIIHALNRTQEVLWNENHWPFLKIWRPENILPGERLYTLPADITMEDVTCLYDTSTGLYTGVGYGIDVEDRNLWPPEARSDPILKWDMVDGAQFEVWPTPATARTLWIEGYRKLQRMSADEHTALLDDNLIVLHAVAEHLARDKKADAGIKASMATRLLQRLTGKLVSDKRGNLIPMLPRMKSPNAAYLGGARRPYGLPPPIPR